MSAIKTLVIISALAVMVLGGPTDALSGPVSLHGLELVNFKLEVPSRPRLGDQVKAVFTLKNNTGKTIVLSRQYGAFLAARWRSQSGARMDRDFGHGYLGRKIEPGQSLTIRTGSTMLNRAGVWSFFPGYNIGGSFGVFTSQSKVLDISGKKEPGQAAHRVKNLAGGKAGNIAASWNQGKTNSLVYHGGEKLPLQIFPADNPWNIKVRGLPVHPKSGEFIQSIGETASVKADFGSGRRFKIYNQYLKVGKPFGIPFLVVRKGEPLVPVRFHYETQSDPGPYPIPLDAPIEHDGKGDAHVLVLHYDDMKLYELFAAKVAGNSWHAGSGAVWDLTSNKLRPLGWTSADAAGLPIFPGLVRYEEVAEQGEIRHALRFTTKNTRRAFIPPATHWASRKKAENIPPMGLRLRLKASYDITPFPRHVRIILRCLQEYGMILADNGADMFITGAPHPEWDDDALQYIRKVKARDFEAVYTGKIITKLK
jgi:hypothetical protein